jgi:hypothetical protein
MTLLAGPAAAPPVAAFHPFAERLAEAFLPFAEPLAEAFLPFPERLAEAFLLPASLSRVGWAFRARSSFAPAFPALPSRFHAVAHR